MSPRLRPESIVLKGSLCIKAPAKVNLFLYILARRPDGYHELKTLFQKVTLFDSIGLEIQEGAHKIHLECIGADLPTGKENLAYRAADLFLQRTGLTLYIKIHLQKRIPSGAGLGGGSSDAAAVLKGLNELTSSPLAERDLMSLGLELGADVPFFIQKAPAALGTGVGEVLEPRPGMPRWFLLVWPGFAISTRWVYTNFELTTQGHKTIFSPGHGHETSLWNNDLEKAVISRYPEISALKKALMDLGAQASLMSGSGSTVFGVFDTREAALKASRGLDALPGSGHFERYVVKGME